jgi:hypothetical protein
LCFGSWFGAGPCALGRLLWGLVLGACGLDPGLWILVGHWALSTGSRAMVPRSCALVAGFDSWLDSGHWVLGSCALTTGGLALAWTLGIGRWAVCFGDWALGLVVWALGFGSWLSIGYYALGPGVWAWVQRRAFGAAPWFVARPWVLGLAF